MIRLWNATVGALLVAVLTGSIRLYQLTISPLLGPVCRYYPSCSHYGLEAIRVHRAAKGVLLTGWRVLRCHPWARGGLDPVPPRGQWPTRVAAPAADSLASDASRTGAHS